MLRSRVCPPHRRRRVVGHLPASQPVPLSLSPARLLFSLAEVLEEEAGEGDFFQRRGSLTDGAESSTHPQRERERERVARSSTSILSLPATTLIGLPFLPADLTEPLRPAFYHAQLMRSVARRGRDFILLTTDRPTAAGRRRPRSRPTEC